MRNLVLFTVVAVLLGAMAIPARAFTHPGAPLSLADLQALKAAIDNNREPWKSAYAALAAEGRSQLTFQMAGPFATVSRAPDENLHQWRSDMHAIWNLSRMWYFTGNPDYAKKARDILLAWANTHTTFSGRESMLDLGDYAYKFVGGADILRGTWPGWTEADTTAVKAYFGNVLMPASNPYGESQFGAANKGALALVSLGLLAIFNDDTAKLDDVVYKVRRLAHIGLRSSNDIGMLGDSLRDQGHAHGQLLSLAMLAEALWKQGIDIYSDYDNRLLAAGEYFARVNELVPTPFLPFGTTDAYYTADNTNRGWGGGNVALSLIHGAYVVRKGLQAPYIAQRRQEMPVDSSSFMFLKEADTSVATPAAALSIPSTTSLTSGFSNVEIGGATPTGGASYSGGLWTVRGGGTEIWSTNDSCHFTYKAITGDCAIVAKVESVQNTSLSAKAGVMMRTSLSQGAPRAWMAVTPRNQAEQNMPQLAVYGGTNYGNKAFNIASSSPSYWVKLERLGNIITGYVSPDGTNWAATDVGRIDAPVPDTLYVGLVVCSVANGTLNTSTFNNVQITGGNGGAPVVTPAAPAALLTAPGDGAVPLRWQPSFGATSYTVKRASSSGGPYSTVASGITASSYTDTTVTNGTTYYYVVTATNSAGTSGNSPEDSATPVRPMVNVAIGGTSAANFNSGSGLEGSDKAFDSNLGSKWYGYTAPTGWIQYDLGSANAQVVKRYTIGSADVSARDPESWNFLGSQDGVSWTTLDSQSDQSFAYRMQLNTYDIGNTTAYRFYRLEITANNGASGVALSELGLWGALPDGLYLAAAHDNGRVALTWFSSATSTYTIKRSTTSGGPYATLATGLTGTTYTDTELTNNVTYYYVVSDANGLDSAEVAATPSALRVHLKFDESGGTFAADSGGHARDATLVNGPTFGAGKLGNALNFTATSSQYATLPNGIASGLADFTLSTWVKVNAFATWQRIFDFGTGTTNYMFLTTQYTPTMPNNAKLRFGIRTPTAAEQSVSGTGIALAAGVWTHVAVTRSGNTMRLYVNGSLAGSGTITLNPSALGVTTQNYLGKSQWNDPYLDGALDDFRIYNYALDATEVATVISGPPSAPASLTATPNGSAAVSLSWSAVAGATSYRVKRSPTSGGPYSVLATDVSSANYNDTGLTAATTYHYVVSAVSVAGESADSTAASATTAAASDGSPGAEPVQATVTLSKLARTYDGTAKPVSVATTPAGLDTTVTYNGSTSVPVNAGSYTVAATVSSSNYTGSATDTLVIARAAQVISFPTPADRVLGDAPFALSASASSGLPVAFSLTDGPATLNGSTVTLTGETGIVSLAASQPGNANYDAAPAVTRSFAVLAAEEPSVAGVYIGTFAEGLPRDGFGLLVRADGTALFAGSVSGTSLVVDNLTLDSGGNFAVVVKPLGETTTVSVSGQVRDGVVTGTLSRSNRAFSGSRSPAAGEGAYWISHVGTAAGDTVAIVDADGRAYLVTTDGTKAGGAAATLDGSGSLVATLSDGSTLSVSLANGAGTLTKSGATTVLSAVPEALRLHPRLINASTRGLTAAGENVLITGFVVSGSTPKRVLIRVAGPSLEKFGVTSPLADPRLRLFRGSATLLDNDNWNAADAADIASTGAFPYVPGSRDAAVIAVLEPGLYTVHALPGATSPANADGVVLTELYELRQSDEPPGARRLVNLSTRGRVTTEPLIIGFVIDGPAARRVLVRAAGPALRAHGVTTFLANPRLRLFSGPTAIRENDDWSDGADAAKVAAAFEATGAFAFTAGAKDAALLVSLQPGPYTAHVESVDGTPGVALVEVYELR